MNDCKQENCPFRSNSSSSVYGCEHIACPNRDDGSVVFITTDHTIIQKDVLKMARAIDANKLIEWFSPYLHTGEPISADVIIEDIRSMPTLTPPNEPLTLGQLRHGRWVRPHWRNSVSCADCSECGAEAHHAEYRGVQKYYRWCPNCGARMDKENETGILKNP